MSNPKPASLDGAEPNLSGLQTIFGDDDAALLAWVADTNFDDIAEEDRQDAAFCFGYFQGVAETTSSDVVSVVTEVMREMKIRDAKLPAYIRCPKCDDTHLHQCVTGSPGCLHCAKCGYTEQRTPGAWSPVCSQDCEGWFLCGESHEVHRCDECDRFESDLEAFAFAVTEGLPSLREQLQKAMSARALEIDVTKRIESAFNAEVCVSYMGIERAFLLRPLDGDSRGRAVLLENGDITVSGWPSKHPTTIEKES